jgi:riboflavin synthase
MFSGIIESLGKVEDLQREGSNLHFLISATFASALKVDQSVAHNGVCLTVTKIEENHYWVTAVEETLKRSNLGTLIKGDVVNLERCISLNTLLDGHLVQGHVDTVARCSQVEDREGSWNYFFEYQNPERKKSWITIEKGSITINGVSLTVVNSFENGFSVTIIPYTFEHTNFHAIKVGSLVNIEFDVIGKYVAKLMQME